MHCTVEGTINRYLDALDNVFVGSANLSDGYSNRIAEQRPSQTLDASLEGSR